MKILLLFFICSSVLVSQLSIKVNDLFLDNDYYLNADLTITLNGQSISPSINDFLLIEQNKSNKPTAISEIAQNQFRVKFKPVYSVIRDPKVFEGTLVLNYNGIITSTFLNYDDLNTPRIIFTKTDGARIETIDFGIATPGVKRIRQAFLRTNSNRTLNGNIVSTRVDSISIDNPNFTVTWDGQLGGIGNPQPPLGILPSVNYLLTFVFTAPSTDPYSAVFTVYYDNGAKAQLLFTANSLEIKESEVEKYFNVLNPNGNELFAPCMDIPINWEGNSNGFNTIIEFSTDDGKNWEVIGSSTSGSFLWDVPKETTDSARIKVSQEFKSLNKITTPTTDTLLMLNYGSDDNLIKIYDTKRISLDLSGEFFLGNSVNQSEFFGTGFLNKTSFVVGLRDKFKISKNDSILVYNTNQPFPVARFATNVFPIHSLKTDEKNEKFYIQQKYGNKIYEYNSKGLLDSIELEGFISSFSISADQNLISAITFEGDLYVINSQTKDIIKRVKIDGTPFIINNSISPNGKIIALGAKINDVSKEAAYVYLLDVESESIFKIFEVAAADPIDLSFNPNSTILVIVSTWSPQVFVWDLIGNKSITGFGGTSGEVIAGSFASSRNTIVVSSKKPNELTKFTLVFPLYDESDTTFSIKDPIISADGIDMDQELIFTKDSIYFQYYFCNNGEVDFILENYWFNSKKDYNISFDKFKDTLKPGECGSFKIYFEPQDIGELLDTLNLSNNCTGNLSIPITGIGLPRNVEYLDNNYSLGTICIHDTIFGNIEVFRNADDVNLDITNIEIIENDAIFNINNFQPVSLSKDEILSFDYMASPLFADVNNIKIRVYFNNQNKYYFEFTLTIDGIGSTLEASHDYLPFIEEEGNRTLKIRNQFDKEIKLLGYNLIPNQGYRIVSVLPEFIMPGEEISIDIEWDKTTTNPVKLIIDADPCPLGNNFVLLPYSATNFIEIPDIQAVTPASDVKIPIVINDSPNKNYNGNRNFNLTINMNPRLFFPNEIQSKYGEGTIVENKIENDLRVIRVNLFGNFPSQDTLMNIIGVSGIAETDFTNINFDKNETSFGKSTSIIFNDGSMKIKGLHNERRVIHSSNQLSIINVSPNPSSESINIELNSDISSEFEILIRNTAGRVVYSTKNYIDDGLNILQIKDFNLSSGNYYLEIQKDNILFDNYSITIIK